MNPIETIMNQLSSALREMEDKFLDDVQIFVKERMAAVKEFAQNNSPRDDVWGYYEKIYEIAGGKSWYKLFHGRNAAMMEEVVKKYCENVSKKRNASIASKLMKVGVQEVTDSSFARTNDGFNGFFRVNTDKGEKVIEIQTIYAGGYNIQCAHLRVLVKVR